MDLGLAGRTALITGASKGIGAAVAEAFAREGAAVVLVARSRTALEATAAALSAKYPVPVAIHVADLRSRDDLHGIAAAHPGIDILVNNAGDVPAGTIADLDEDAWQQAWDLKVMGTINLTRLYYRLMKDRGGGVIVNNIGIAGERPRAGYIAGGTGCAALMALTKGIGNQSLFDGIRVVGVNTGSVETDRLVVFKKAQAKEKWGDENRFRELYDDLPLKRPARPDEVADLVVFLSSPRAGFISGSVHTIDGGGTTRATRGL